MFKIFLNNQLPPFDTFELTRPAKNLNGTFNISLGSMPLNRYLEKALNFIKSELSYRHKQAKIGTMLNGISKLKAYGLAIIFLPFKANWYLTLGLQHSLNRIKSGLGSRIRDLQVELNDNRAKQILHTSKSGEELSLRFFTPNYICDYRVRTFSTKEPETLDWIDEFGGEGAFFDIGANIGLYSIYCAARHSQPVFAFEPSLLNTRQLLKNINANKLSNLVSIITTPITEVNQIADFKLSSVDEGGALSSFGVGYDQNGENFVEKIHFKTIGFSLNALSTLGLIPNNPSLIKIDVDGIEDLILKGASNILSNPSCKSVLVEVNSKFKQQKNGVSEVLLRAGFELRNANSREYDFGFNQVWTRNL